MKAIMISIRPKHTANILNGIKKIEVRTTCPKDWRNYLSGKTKTKPEPIPVLIYCTKMNKNGNTQLLNDACMDDNECWFIGKDISKHNPNDIDFSKVNLNGKVVARFTLNKVEEIQCYEHYEPECDIGIGILPEFTCNAYQTNTLGHFELLEKSCLQDLSISSAYHIDELDLYLKGKTGYAWHIDNLEIFNKPKELEEFNNLTDDYYWNGKWYHNQLTKAPQSWCYVEA